MPSWIILDTTVCWKGIITRFFFFLFLHQNVVLAKLTATKIRRAKYQKKKKNLRRALLLAQKKSN